MKKKKTHIGLVVLIALLLIVVAGGAGFMIGSSMIKPPSVHVPSWGHSDEQNNNQQEEENERADGVYNVLIVGVDKVALNTDTILVASLDSKEDKINILSIPRDTMSNVSRSVKKINSAFGTGAKDGKGNIDNLKKEVSYLVGFDVDNYVVVNLSAFEELIDAIGGVKIDVPRNMNYDDPYQNLHIHIQAGEQVLNGEQAVGFCRYRSGYAEGDLGRVKAQQMFMKALIRQVATPSILTKVPQLAKIIEENMETDLTTGEILWFAKEAIGVNLEEDLQTFILPGEARWAYSLSYYIPDASAILEIVNAHFNPYETEIKRSDLNIVDLASLPKENRPQKQDEEKNTDEDNEEESENPLENEALKPTDSERPAKDGGDEKTEQSTNHKSEKEEDTQPDNNTGVSGDTSASGTDAMPGEVLKGNQESSESDNTPAEQGDSSPKQEEPSHNEEVDSPAGGGNVPGEVLKSDIDTE